MGVKRVMGPWQFAAGLDLGYGDFDDRRMVSNGGASTALKSDYDVTTLGGRLLAAYQVPFAYGYVRPLVDLDVIYTHVPGYEEGSDGLALAVEGQDETTFVLTPAVELAGRFDLTDRFVMRPFATMGVRFLSQDDWKVQARLLGAQDEAGSFQSSTAMPDVLGDFQLGLQVFQEVDLELSLAYHLQMGDDCVGQAANVRVAYRF
jgi:uncharacterized protein with beta-barrel porin domain